MQEFFRLRVVPPLPPGMRYLDVAVGALHFLALRSDGNVIAWSNWNQYGQLNVPSLPSGTRYVAIDAGRHHSVARRSDGMVVVWGDNGYFQHNVPSLEPGMTITKFSAGGDFTIALFGSGGFEPFGAGCPGRAGITRLEAREQPQVGQTLVTALTPQPPGAAVVVVGFSNTSSPFGPLPLDLAVVGMPGCLLRVSADLALSVSGNLAEARLAIPKDHSLAGGRFHLQALILEPGVNALGAVLSDAATAVIGS